MTKIRRLTVAAGAAGFLLASVAVANAQHPPATPTPGPTAAQCTLLSNTAPRQGEEVTAEGTANCFVGNEFVEGFILSTPVRVFRVQASANGSYRATFTIPLTVAPGPHTFRVSGVSSGRVYERPIVIQAAAAARLPRTGTDLLVLMLWATVLLVSGTFLISATWKRYQFARARTRMGAPTGSPPMLSATHSPVVATRAEDNFAYEPNGPEPEEGHASDDPEQTARPRSDTARLVAELREEIDAWTKR